MGRLNFFKKKLFPKKIDFIQIGCGRKPTHLNKKAIKNPEKTILGIDPELSFLHNFFSRKQKNLFLYNLTDLKLLKILKEKNIKVPEIDFQMPHELLPKLDSRFFELLDSVLAKNGKITLLTDLTENQVMHFFGGFLRGRNYKFNKESPSQELINESKSAKGFQKNYSNTKITRYVFTRKN